MLLINNVSPNGAIEYKSSVFNGALKGKLLVVRYSQYDDIITLTPGTTKDITSSIEGASITGFSGFIDPLDLTENVKNGNIYVSEYGGDGKITLLKPNTSTTVTAQKIDKAETVSANNSPKQFPACDDTAAVTSQTAKDALNANADNSEKPRVNPNPIQKRFNIEFPKKYEGDFTIQIIDPLGKIYEIGKKRLKAGGSAISFDISSFSFKSGIYFLKIESDTKTEVNKIVIQ